MNWENRFSERTRLMQQSTVREFLKHATRQDIISFAGGLPDPELLPVKETREAVDRALTSNGARALQYGVTEGVGELRELIAARFPHIGVTPESVLITTGSQQALDLVGRVLLNEGDKVAVQNPTYLAALSGWRTYGAAFLPGESRLPLAPEPKAVPNLIYCIPNFINPTGESLDENERNLVLDYSLNHSIPLLEDDPYGDLRYDNTPKPRSMIEMAGDPEGPVIHIGTFSKVLAPGFRVGWIVAARELIAKLALAKQTLDLHTSTFAQYVVVELLKGGIIDNSLPPLQASYCQKRDLLLEALNNQFITGATMWTRPHGGFFVLLSLEADLDGTLVARAALENGVLVVPGADFHVRGGSNSLRLSFSNAPRLQIADGVARLHEAIMSAHI